MRAAQAACACAFDVERREHPLRAREILVIDPHLRPGDVGRDIAHDRRHVLVEDLRLDVRVQQAVAEEPRVDPVVRVVEAFYARSGLQWASASTSRRSTASSAAARGGSQRYGGASSM